MRPAVLLVIAVFAATGIGVAVWKLLPRDETSPAPASAGPGLFVYDTSGFESVDAFGGARHTYPAHTTISVRATAGGCRVYRWRPFTQRYWEWETCGDRLVRFGELHRFFGRDDKRDWRCDETSTLTGGWRCTAQGTTETGTLVSPGRVATRMTGDTTGSGLRELRLRPDGVPRLMLVENESTTPSFLGDVHYRERYELRLRPG